MEGPGELLGHLRAFPGDSRKLLDASGCVLGSLMEGSGELSGHLRAFPGDSRKLLDAFGCIRGAFMGGPGDLLGALRNSRDVQEAPGCAHRHQLRPTTSHNTTYRHFKPTTLSHFCNPYDAKCTFLPSKQAGGISGDICSRNWIGQPTARCGSLTKLQLLLKPTKTKRNSARPAHPSPARRQVASTS